jgi:hypothetical protein
MEAATHHEKTKRIQSSGTLRIGTKRRRLYVGDRVEPKYAEATLFAWEQKRYNRARSKAVRPTLRRLCPIPNANAQTYGLLPEHHEFAHRRVHGNSPFFGEPIIGRLCI